MVRVLGSVFSFYSTAMSDEFLDSVADYQLDPREAVVNKLELTASDGKTMQDKWALQSREDRKIVIQVLDHFLQIIVSK